MGIGGESLGQPAGAEGGREVINEFGGGDEARVEAVLNGTTGDGDRQDAWRAR